MRTESATTVKLRLLMPLFVLMVHVCVLKNVFELPMVASLAIEASDLGQRDSISDIAMPDDSEEYIVPWRKRFKVVRNSNGSLSLLILDESPFTTAEQMSSDDIVFDDDNDNSYEHGVGDNYNDMKMGLVDTLAAGAGKTTTRQQHTTYEVDLSRPARASPNDGIVFPMEQSMVPTPCADNRTFCEDLTNYPADDIEKIINREVNRFQGLFDSVDDVLTANAGLSNRFADDDAQPMCDSTIVTEYPTKWKREEDDSWATIVNTPNYKQGVRLERCKNPEGQCNFAKNFGSKVQTSCRQMFMDRKLLTVMNDAKGDQKAEYSRFRFPSCCQCRVTSNP